MNSESAQTPPGTGRIETFSDGVMAILITIMVLELKLPADLFHGGDLAQVLAAFWPKLIVYALSFLMIAIILVNHHMILRAAPHSTNGLYWWNTNLLFWLSLVPLATAVLGNAPVEPAAVAFYGTILTVTAVSFTLLHRCAVAIGSKTGKPNDVHRLIILKDSIFTGFYAISVPLAFVSVYASMTIFLIVPAAYFFPDYVPWPHPWRTARSARAFWR
ncbi:MAG TPA: TMEM175 family protein [Rhizomicrobium sp.]